MPAHSPKAVHELWAQAFSARDLDALVALYEPGATLVPQPGEPVAGHAAIRDALDGFLALGGEFALHPATIVLAGDVALLVSSWTLAGTGPDGTPIEMAGRTADVVRRQADGTWLIVIDNPFGTAP